MKALIFVVVLLGLSACGNPPAPDDEPADGASVFDPMTDSLDRAREVEELNAQRKSQLDEQLEQAEH
ncbi:MAG TPA: hypothetical protein ENK16_00675 [Chromatiales bacterium]|nr:hypothetical protein [Chromatiales bacterium]